MNDGTLVVWITKGDEEFANYKLSLNGAEMQYQVSYHSSSKSLGNYDGKGKYPLVLVSHANEKRFTTDQSVHPKIRETASDVAKALIAKGLVPERFSCVLVAGCKGASSNKEDSLYIDLGNALKRPVVASNTVVEMSLKADTLSLTPQDGGHWKVYYPEDEEIASLSTARCKALRESIDKSCFRCIDVR